MHIPDAAYVFDLFQACLASCQQKHLEVALYADSQRSFACKARWWACPTGDPNAGKSPACSCVLQAFEDFAREYANLLSGDQRWIGAGNNNRVQERLRTLGGALLVYGPEAKPILDPNFPLRKTVDIGKYLDLTRWLVSEVLKHYEAKRCFDMVAIARQKVRRGDWG